MNLHSMYEKLHESIKYTLPYKIVYLRALSKRNFRFRTLLTYPYRPIRAQILYKLAHVLGYYITNNPNIKADIVMNFEDTTFRTKDDVLRNLRKKFKVINYYCDDISKLKVDRVLKDTFGYSLSIDPLVYQGKAIKKSNFNAMRAAEIITCPIKQVENNFVYQRLVNNDIDDSWVLDLRTPIYGKDIPFVYMKYRSRHNRFDRNSLKAKIVETNQVFTPQETEKILLFCEGMGLDFGELDILRDTIDGNLYIVDANNTPMGPPWYLAEEEKQLALATLCFYFEKNFGNSHAIR
jgi:RNAse (barnase) inhibitor barstar